MNKIKYLILPTIATLTVIWGSALSSNQAKELWIVDFFSQDKLLHFTSYFVLTILWAYGLYKIKRKRPILTATLVATLVGILMEVCQYSFFEGRQFEFLDIIANISGSLVGALIFKTIIKGE